MKNRISLGRNMQINLKLYSGLDVELGIRDYDPYNGLILEIPPKSNIKRMMKVAGFKLKSHYRFFCNGEQVGAGHKLKEGDQITVIIPTAGG